MGLRRREKKPVIQRPRSVAILVMLQVFQGIGLIAYSLYMGELFGWGFEQKDFQFLHIAPIEVFETISSGTLYLVLAILTLYIALALWLLNSWAWIAAMTLQGFSLFAALVGYLGHQPNYISMLLSILLVFYLNQQEVQAVFRRKL